MKPKIFLLFLLIFQIFLFLPNSLAQEISPYNMVRLVYFVPRQRQPQPDINPKLDTLIKNAQQFFANEMVHHGFGRKTFVFETDTDGNAVVHRVNGSYVDAYYHHQTDLKVAEEVARQFDFSKNVYLMIVDISTERIDGACGKGGNTWNRNGDWGGRAFIPASGHCLNTNFGVELAAHELGHAFSVFHDFSNDAYLMSYGENRTELSLCTAEWLNANRYFNSRQTPPNNSKTTFQMLPPLLSPPYSIHLRFEVSDSDGLQQAQLLTPATSIYEAPGEPKSLGCKKLEGESQVVEFVTTELTTQSKTVTLLIIDGAGNFSWELYPLSMNDLFPSPQVISIPDANLASAVREELELRRFSNITQLDMLKLTALLADNHRITDLSGLEHATNLKYLFLKHNQITEITTLAGLTNLAVLALASNQINDFAPVAGLTKLLELDISENPGDDISPVTELEQLQALHLRGHRIQDLTPFTRFTNLLYLQLERNQIGDLTPLAELTQLRDLSLWDNQVRDLTPLTELTHLEWLDLSKNQISDLTPLENLTKLRVLQLAFNQTTDLTPLAQFRNLTHLVVSGNQISDLVPLAALTNLKVLIANRNQISNIAPLTRLKQLETLWLTDNQVSNLGPLTQLFNLIELRVAGNPIADRTTLRILLDRNASLELDVDPTQLFPAVYSNTPEPPPMYWTDTETSGFHRLVGNKKIVENAALEVENITALTTEVSNGGKLFWIEQTSNSRGKIGCADLDGSNIQVVKRLFSLPRDIATDPQNRKIYCTNANGKIQRLNFDGSNFEANLITNLEAPNHIALDVGGGKLYWTEADESIRRANLDGSNIETLATDLGTLGGLAIAGGKLYWTEQVGKNTGKVQRANLDATNVQTLTTLKSIPLGITVDTAGRKLYWTNAIGKIQRANLNGKNIQTLITGLGEPTNLVLGIGTATTSAAPPILVSPDTTALLPNYPNPFNPETWIPYQLSEPADVTLRIYAANGVLVRTLALGQLSAGVYQNRSRAAYWDGKNESGESVASGLYFYTLSADDFTATRKMLIRK